MAWELGDLATEACLDEFGEEAIITPQNGTPFGLRGVFTELGGEILWGGVPVQTLAPVFEATTSTLGAARQGDKLTVSGRDWRLVENPRPSGEGTVLVHLESYVSNP